MGLDKSRETDWDWTKAVKLDVFQQGWLHSFGRRGVSEEKVRMKVRTHFRRSGAIFTLFSSVLSFLEKLINWGEKGHKGSCQTRKKYAIVKNEAKTQEKLRKRESPSRRCIFAGQESAELVRRVK